MKTKFYKVSSVVTAEKFDPTQEPTFKLPDGYETEVVAYAKNRFLIVRSPSRYVVTVDFEQRCYRLGYAETGRIDSTATYGGRNWRAYLVGHAVARLVDLEIDKTAR